MREGATIQADVAPSFLGSVAPAVADPPNPPQGPPHSFLGLSCRNQLSVAESVHKAHTGMGRWPFAGP
jgi:hypothetical protein